METAISVTNVSKSYKGKHPVTALSGINLQIQPGELFGLIGPDGAGKSSLFRILATLLLPDTGFATINGADVVTDYRLIRNQIGYMPGRFSLYQDLTIQENLQLFADVFGTTIQDNLERIGPIYAQIEPFKKRRAGKLSGGMKQKLALCCALIHKPRVLLLDEPTTGVDPVSRQEFWQTLTTLKEQHMTILVSTPYMDEATLCDRIALIQSGKIMSVDKPQAILASYPYKLYRAKAPDNYQLLMRFKAAPQVKLCYINGEYVHVVFTDAHNRPDIPCDELTEVPPTIEDCFIQLIKDECDRSTRAD